ncbi:MAG: SOS response-associated peptidase [Faecousia sp.]
MCGRFYVPEDDSAEMIRTILEYLEHRNVMVKTGDVFPGDIAAVVASNRRCEPQPFAMEWGYHLSDGKRIINARSETAAQKAMFADGIRQRRCLIPVRHYYEWEKADDRKVKYAIEPNGSDVFFLAGIYRMEAGKPVFTVLTKNAAEDIAFIHERMPVILPNEAAADWLNPKYHGDDILKEAQLNMKYTAC